MDDNMFTFFEAALYAKEGENPSKAIENQEKRGQKEVVNLQLLPKKPNPTTVPDNIRFANTNDEMDWKERSDIVIQNCLNFIKQQYERIGITIVDEHDNLFYNVTLPKGWEIKSMGHSMWNALYDDKGRKRAQFFYKAAFYDRDAFIAFNTRFSIRVDHIGGPDMEYEKWRATDIQGTVNDCENVIFQTECVKPTGDYAEDDKINNNLTQILETYMKENYPDYKDINAYWD